MVSKKDRDLAMKAIIEYKTEHPDRSITPDFLTYKGIASNKYAEEIIDVLESMGYLKCTVDRKDHFKRIDLAPSGKHYFETQSDIEENQRKKNLHDWKIAIFSALAGALISEPLWSLIRFLSDLFPK